MWHYSYEVFFYVGYEKTEKVNDTVINGINCDHYLVTINTYDLTSGISNTQYDSAYTYIQNDSLYHWVNGQFYLLAPFNANAGNTWLIADAGNCTDSSYFYVDSIGQTVIQNDTLRTLFLTAHVSGIIYPTPITLTEKLGFDFAMFPYWSCQIDSYLPGPFRCYSDSSGFSYSSNIVPYCNFTTSVIELKEETIPVQVTVSAIANQLHIRNKNKQSGLLSLYDKLGKKIMEIDLKAEELTELVSFENVCSDLYFWQFETQSGNLSSGKFAIIK